jgi:hypothetical protein
MENYLFLSVQVVKTQLLKFEIAAFQISSAEEIILSALLS